MDTVPSPPLPPLEAPEQQEPPVEEQDSASASASAVHDTLVAPAAASTSASGSSSSGSPPSSSVVVLLHPSAANNSNNSSSSNSRKRKRRDNGDDEDADDDEQQRQQQRPPQRQRGEDDGPGPESDSEFDDPDDEGSVDNNGVESEDGLELRNDNSRPHGGGAVAARVPSPSPTSRAAKPPPPRRSSPTPTPMPSPDPRQYFALWQKYCNETEVEPKTKGQGHPIGESGSENVRGRGGNEGGGPGGEGQQQQPQQLLLQQGGGDLGVATGTARSDNGNDDAPTGAAAGAKAVGIPAAAAATDRPVLDNGVGNDTPILGEWEDELALANYNDGVRNNVQDCFDRANELQRAIQELHRQIHACYREADAIEKNEHHRIMVLPSLAQSNADYFWREGNGGFLTPEVQCSTKLAWALLRADDSPLPLPFQRMLWMDPNCPLRNDRQILMASIEKGLDQLQVDIVWTPEWAKDRELVLTCFRKCPGCLSDRNQQDPDPIKPYLKDMEALRAFALSMDACPYRSSWYAKCAGGIHTQFSRTLFTDPDFMADLFVHLCRRSGNDAWARSRLKKAFPQLEWTAPPKKVGGVGDPTATTKPAPTSSKTSAALLDNVEFAIRVAEGLAGLPQENRALCPVTYATLTRRLQNDTRVALAFVKVDARVAGWAPLSLRRNKDVWNQLWTAATNQDPRVIYHEALKSAPCKSLLSSKELVLRLLETACTRGADGVDEFAPFFFNFARPIRHDQVVNMRLVVTWAKVRRPSIRVLISPGYITSRDFWTDLLAQQPSCTCAAWKLVPKELANDERLALVWARNVCPDGAIEWLAFAVATFPTLDLLSDRHVLLNWLPKLCQNKPTAEKLRTQVPSELLNDSSLWIELFHKLGTAYNILKYIPEALRSDPNVVEAQLQCAAKRDEVLERCFGRLPRTFRYQFLHHIVNAIHNCDVATFHETWQPFAEGFKLYRFPEAVLAVLAKGGHFKRHEFWSQPWRNDPEFLLQVADATATRPDCRLFWECCSEPLRRDKSFVLRLLKDAHHVPELFLDDQLERDHDIMFARFVRMPAFEVREFLHCHHHHNRGNDRRAENFTFARTVRARLQSYVCLQVFMSGIDVQQSANGGAESSTIIPLQMLGQDDDTVSDFRCRLVEYLGCPSTIDEARDLRTVSNKLILAGY